MSRRSRSQDSSSKHSSDTLGARIERLNLVLFEELAALVQDELRDPRLADVILCKLELSVDARTARVHYLVRGPDGPGRGARVADGLTRATPFLRARLAEAVDLKRAVDLRFIHQGFVPMSGEP
ncbi:MAG: ribosome-binding factor A [Myxococcales bacterium]|nr:ribosome-binding factor A [Myxococcales bacterium]